MQASFHNDVAPEIFFATSQATLSACSACDLGRVSAGCRPRPAGNTCLDKPQHCHGTPSCMLWLSVARPGIARRGVRYLRMWLLKQQRRRQQRSGSSAAALRVPMQDYLFYGHQNFYSLQDPLLSVRAFRVRLERPLAKPNHVPCPVVCRCDSTAVPSRSSKVRHRHCCVVHCAFAFFRGAVTLVRAT